MNTHTRSSITPFRFATLTAALVVAAVSTISSAEIITYSTTLTVTPGSIQFYGNYDEDGTFYPTSSDLYDNPNWWMTPGDRFELTFTVDTSARLSGYDISPYGRFFRARDFVLNSTFRPFNSNLGVISQEFTYGPQLNDDANGSSSTLGVYSNFIFYPYRSLFISHFGLSFDLPVNVAGEGLSLDQLMGPLDGLTPNAGAYLGPAWDLAGSICFQASPLIRIIPAPSAAALLGLGGALAARRRR